ncbi:MAG: hypothetical protein OXF84_13035 [Bacteroidetes bacterium]|nr:hypothetical protein [Bacteroidota bacterium]
MDVVLYEVLLLISSYSARFKPAFLDQTIAQGLRRDSILVGRAALQILLDCEPMRAY